MSNGANFRPLDFKSQPEEFRMGVLFDTFRDFRRGSSINWEMKICRQKGCASSVFFQARQHDDSLVVASSFMDVNEALIWIEGFETCALNSQS